MSLSIPCRMSAIGALLVLGMLLGGGCAAPSVSSLDFRSSTAHSANANPPPMPSQKSALTELQGSVRVLNHTTQPLALSADGSPVGTLFSGDDARVDALAPGPVRLMAESADGSMRFATTLEVRPGHLPQWNVDEPAAVAEFVNLTDEALRIEAGEQVLNRLAPGDRVLLEGLEAGTLSCTAQCLRSHSVLAAELSLESGAVTRWVITRDPSTAVVQNPTSEFVRVSVNGKERVRIPDFLNYLRVRDSLGDTGESDLVVPLVEVAHLDLGAVLDLMGLVGAPE